MFTPLLQANPWEMQAAAAKQIAPGKAYRSNGGNVRKGEGPGQLALLRVERGTERNRAR